MRERSGRTGDIIAAYAWRSKIEKRNGAENALFQIVFYQAVGKEGIAQSLCQILGQLGAVINFHREPVMAGKQVLDIQTDSLQRKITE